LAKSSKRSIRSCRSDWLSSLMISSILPAISQQSLVIGDSFAKVILRSAQPSDFLASQLRAIPFRYTDGEGQARFRPQTLDGHAPLAIGARTRLPHSVHEPS